MDMQIYLKFLNQSETRLIAIKGLLCAIFGIVCMITVFLDDKNFTVMAYALGSLTLISGLITFVSMLSHKIVVSRLSMFHYEGMASFIMGMLILVFPEMAVTVFMSILGGIAVGIGLMQIALAFDLDTYKVKEIMLIYSGILTVLLGVILFNNPDAISQFVNILLSVFFTTVGGYITYFAWKLIQQKEQRMSRISSAPAPYN